MTSDERLRRIDILARAIRMLAINYSHAEWTTVSDFSWAIAMLASMPAPWLEMNDKQFQNIEVRAAVIIAAREKQRITA